MCDYKKSLKNLSTIDCVSIDLSLSLSLPPPLPPSLSLSLSPSLLLTFLIILTVLSLQIENFWGTYNNIVPPSGLDKCANYHFFKEGIFPLWEDEANKQGGKWVLTIKDDTTSLDHAWIEVVSLLCVSLCMCACGAIFVKS